MDNVKQEFDNRKKEVEQYLDFLNIVSIDNATITYAKKQDTITSPITNDIQRILIANSFLILYNLIESTIRMSIVEIYETIQKDEITYTKLSDKLKKIWIKKNTKNMKEGNFSIDTLNGNIEKMINAIINKEIAMLTKDDIDISGNVDARKIRTLSESIGFKKAQNEQNGQNLVTIKNKRNSLAHGNSTFYDIGKDFTVNEINGFKQEIFLYLEEIVTNIEKYITLKQYIMQ